MVFQRPCGTLAASLRPCGAHPRSGAMFVLVWTQAAAIAEISRDPAEQLRSPTDRDPPRTDTTAAGSKPGRLRIAYSAPADAARSRQPRIGTTRRRNTASVAPQTHSTARDERRPSPRLPRRAPRIQNRRSFVPRFARSATWQVLARRVAQDRNRQDDGDVEHEKDGSKIRHGRCSVISAVRGPAPPNKQRSNERRPGSFHPPAAQSIATNSEA